MGALGAAAGLAAACTSATPNSASSASTSSASSASSAAPTPVGTQVEALVSTPVAASSPSTDPAGAATDASAAATDQPTASASAGPRRLVVLQLSGGHDGLNAVIPYGDGLYYQLRPQIGITADKVLHLDDHVGLHPNLASFKSLFDKSQLAILQSVGYPRPNRSHFRSMEIWHTARPDGPAPDQGWLGAFMAEIYRSGDSPFECVNFGASVPQALHTAHAPIAAIQDTSTFQFLVDRRLPSMKEPLLKTFSQVATRPAQTTPALQQVADTWDATDQGVKTLSSVTEKYRARAQYPNNPLGKTLQQVAQMLSSDTGTRVIYLQQGGFDTHSNEKPQHATLMTQLADSLAAFQADLEGQGLAEQVVTMSFSEFGRRVKENGSQGTDHGAAGPMFVLGKGVSGGLYGDHPSLSDLDDGDLKFGIDFRSVYATVLENWLGASAQDLLGGTFDKLNFLTG
jgi:uncharacterized protein (DUF1501 family)